MSCPTQLSVVTKWVLCRTQAHWVCRAWTHLPRQAPYSHTTSQGQAWAAAPPTLTRWWPAAWSRLTNYPSINPSRLLVWQEHTNGLLNKEENVKNVVIILQAILLSTFTICQKIQRATGFLHRCFFKFILFLYSKLQSIHFDEYTNVSYFVYRRFFNLLRSLNL